MTHERMGLNSRKDDSDLPLGKLPTEREHRTGIDCKRGYRPLQELLKNELNSYLPGMTEMMIKHYLEKGWTS